MRQSQKILVVDDDPRWLETVKTILEPEHDLVLTSSHREALRRVKRESFSLVILDQRLREPGGRIDGLEVLAAMRKTSPYLPAIILTGFYDADAAVRSLRAGAIDYIDKGCQTQNPVKPGARAAPKLSAGRLRGGRRAGRIGADGEQGDLHSRLRHSVRSVLSSAGLVPSVFLSYERQDQRKVLNYHTKLSASSFLPWMDRKNILGGKKWRPEIEVAIRECDYFIAFLSPHSVDKTGHVWVEFSMALEEQKRHPPGAIYLIPARLAKCEIPVDFKQFHVVDLFRREGYSELVDALSSRQNVGHTYGR